MLFTFQRKKTFLTVRSVVPLLHTSISDHLDTNTHTHTHIQRMPTCVPEWSLFLLDHPFPSQLATSQWQSDASSPSAGYLAYRAVLCVLGVAGMAAYIATLTYDKVGAGGCRPIVLRSK